MSGSKDGRWLAAIDTEYAPQANHDIVRVYNATTRQLEYEMNLGDRLMSVSISNDCRHMLVNKYDGEAQLIDLVTRELVQKFLGYTGNHYLIRAAFGGANESFVVSGSEGTPFCPTRLARPRRLTSDTDGNVWIWHKATGAAVERLPGHAPRTNSASWNPVNPYMLASCGDDGKVKM
jgi:WD repeat-containing protein 26